MGDGILIYSLQTLVIFLKFWTLAITGSTSPGTSSTNLTDHYNIIKFHAHMVKSHSALKPLSHVIISLIFLQMFQSVVLLSPSH